MLKALLPVNGKLVLQWGKVFLTTVGTGLFISIFAQKVEVTSFLFSWTLNFSLMFWISLVELQLQPALRHKYFKEQAWEKQGKIYEKLGVHWFRKLLVISGWEKLSQKKNPVRKNTTALLQLERATRVSEFGHLVIVVLVLLITIPVSFSYSVSEAIWLTVLNILLNVYPILVQRYNRPRLRRLMQRHQLIASV